MAHERQTSGKAASSCEAYVPQVRAAKQPLQRPDEFWARLVDEAEQADRRALEGCPEPAPAPQGASLGQLAPFEERYERLMGVVTNKPSHREILLRTLSLCTVEQPFEAVEEAIQGYPEFPGADQNPYRLITYLVEGGGLDLIELDAQGDEVEEGRKAGLTEDEVDDLVASYGLLATDVGAKLAEDLSAPRRLKDLFSLFTDRATHYVDLLEFCKQPRTFKDIEALFASRDLSGLKTLHPESGLAIRPTVLVDNMEKAGAIVWKGERWVLTKEAEAFLEAMGPLA